MHKKGRFRNLTLKILGQILKWIIQYIHTMTPWLLLRVGLAASRSLRHFPWSNGDLPYAETWLVLRTPPIHHITSHHITPYAETKGPKWMKTSFAFPRRRIFILRWMSTFERRSIFILRCMKMLKMPEISPSINEINLPTLSRTTPCADSLCWLLPT